MYTQSANKVFFYFFKILCVFLYFHVETQIESPFKSLILQKYTVFFLHKFVSLIIECSSYLSYTSLLMIISVLVKVGILSTLVNLSSVR